MLYVIHGTDTKKTRKKLSTMLDALQTKRPDATQLKMTPETWNEKELDEMISGIGLFVPKNIIVLDSLISNKESEECVLKRIGDFASSEHICVLIEGKLTKEEIKKLEKKAEKIEEHNVAESVDSVLKKKKAPETFAFADALLSRNKVRSWTIFQSLVEGSVAAEEIHGVLWWQFKSLFLVSTTKSAKEAGLNPYVYQKCQGFMKQWKTEEVNEMMDRLVSMYHKAHRGQTDFMVELEMMCL